jgi:predicted transcriptional regulator
MENLSIKSDVIALVEKVSDLQVLEAIRVLLTNKVDDQDFWDTLPDFQKKSIERGLEQAAKGETRPHEEVMKKYEKWV